MPAVFLPHIQYIYFDFDNVLVKRAENRAALVARMLGLPDAAALRNFYFVEFHHDPVLERRYLSLRTVEAEMAFYRDIFRLFVERERVHVSHDRIVAAATAFINTPFETLPGVQSALGRLSSRYTLGIFTNGLPSRHHEIEISDLGQYFKNVVISSDYGIEKPAPALYEKAIEIAGLPAARLALVDDEPANIAGAERAGFGQAILFTPEFWQQAQ